MTRLPEVSVSLFVKGGHCPLTPLWPPLWLCKETGNSTEAVEACSLPRTPWGGGLRVTPTSQQMVLAWRAAVPGQGAREPDRVHVSCCPHLHQGIRRDLSGGEPPPPKSTGLPLPGVPAHTSPGPSVSWGCRQDPSSPPITQSLVGANRSPQLHPHAPWQLSGAESPHLFAM